MKIFMLVPVLAFFAAVSSGCAGRPIAPTPYVVPLDRILLLHQQGLTDEKFIEQIEAQRPGEMLTSDDLDRLRKARVSDGVVRYLQGRSAARQGLQPYPYAYRGGYSYYPPIYLPTPVHHFGGYHHGGYHDGGHH